MADWSFQIANSALVSQGEIVNLHEGKVSVPLNKVRTASFKVRMDNPLVPYIAVQSVLEPLYVKAYRNGSLMFYGPLMTAEEVYGEDQKATYEVNAAGPEIIFASRYAGRTATGTVYASGTQLAVRFKELLAASNALSNGETHIDYTTGPIECTNTSAYESLPFKLLSEVLSEMYNQASGFDWAVYPEDGLAAKKIGRLVTKDTINTVQSNAVFEWGTGRANIATFGRKVDLTTMANQAYNISSAGPEATGAPTISGPEALGAPKFETALKEAAEALQAIWGRRETMVSVSVLSEALRKSITEETVNVRDKPRQTITMTPVAQLEGVEARLVRVPVFGTDYGVGDSVPVRLVYEGQVHFDAIARIWGVDFSVDESGRETQTLTLSDS